ncbi:MAG: VacJ family lipoprotein [Terricaulis sp.]
MRGFVAALLVTAACVGAPASAYAQEFVYDPFEPFNRRMFAVHEAIDKAVLEPVARGYRAVTPQPVRTGVRNFLRNLRAPVVFANDVLQGEPDRAGNTFARFGLNTTVGLLGILDPATGLGLERHDEDFGQTLAVWGVPSGPYLWVPILGPTTIRDGGGQIVDIAFNPLTYAEYDGEAAVNGARIALTAVSARAGVIEAVENVRENSVDPYVTFRTTYGLWRYSAIQNGRRDVQDLPEFEEIPDSERPGWETPGLEGAPADPAAPASEQPPEAEQQSSNIDEASFALFQ